MKNNSPEAGTIYSEPARPEVVAAGVRLACARTVSQNYEMLLHQMVFANQNRPPPQDRKLALHNQKLLLSDDAFKILAILFGESCTDEELATQKWPRLFPDGNVNVYRLAVMLASGKEDLAKTVSKIRNISLAAADYGLIERESSSRSLTVLRPTPLLHDLMIEHAIECERAISVYVARMQYIGIPHATL